jgi:CheY-like chemotaxis protein
MPYAAISFVDIDNICFQSTIGFEVESLSRNDWFDAYTILPESSEVYVIADCSTDARFKEKAFVKSGPKIKFYAGAAIMIDDCKLGVLSIMDIEAHNYFGLEDKENLLDLGAAVAQLAKEKLQKALNLSAERANIVVSMMHHLRTPMTSLNFATSLLCNDIQQIKADAASIDQHLHPVPSLAAPSADLSQENIAAPNHNSYSTASNGNNSSENTAHNQSQSDPDNQNTDPNQQQQQPLPTLFQSFESSFNEINMALNQLNVLVDSSLSLGQAIIKCSNQDANPQLSALSPNPLMNNMNINSNPSHLVSLGMDPKKNKFSECNLIEYLRDMFHHHLPIHNNHLDVEWVIDTTELSRGTHVTFPDAIMLIVISTISHMSTESNSLGFYFTFQMSEEDDYEYPELVNKMIEGQLSVKILAKDEKLHRNLVKDGTISSGSNQSRSSNNGNGNTHNNVHQNIFATLSHDPEAAELLTKQNFLSIDKILRAINGSSKEYVEDIAKFDLMEGDVKDPRTIHEFFIPCKILLHPNHIRSSISTSSPFLTPGLPQHNHSFPLNPQERQRIRFYRPPTLNSFGLNDCGIKVTYENPSEEVISEERVPGEEGDNLLTATNNLPFTVDNTNVNSANNPNEENKSGDIPDSPIVEVKPQKVLRVLVVEDTIPVQKLLTRWLQNHGCEVTCAGNGKIGLDHLMASHFDIAFVDFLMVRNYGFFPFFP